ncbi:MAG: DUF2905 domain-containing protein [Candidatus Omnitrophota bacterium]
MQGIAKTLVFMGILLICVGAVIILAQKIPFLGRLPGDFYIKKGQFTFYFPLATSLLLSLLISVLLWIFSRR